MQTIIPLMTRKANERRRRWKMSSWGILLPRGQVVLSNLSLLATRSRNLLLAGMKIQLWDGASVEVEAQDGAIVGQMHPAEVWTMDGAEGRLVMIPRSDLPLCNLDDREEAMKRLKWKFKILLVSLFENLRDGD